MAKVRLPIRFGTSRQPYRHESPVGSPHSFGQPPVFSIEQPRCAFGAAERGNHVPIRVQDLDADGGGIAIRIRGEQDISGDLDGSSKGAVGVELRKTERAPSSFSLPCFPTFQSPHRANWAADCQCWPVCRLD